jgi:Interferon-induced transmembrane protein
MLGLGLILIITATVVVVVVAVTLIVRTRRSQIQAAATAQNTMRSLRLQALSAVPENTTKVAATDSEPFALIVDIGGPAATTTLFVSLDGEASLYRSSGHGVLRCVAPEVQSAALKLIEEGARFREQMAVTRNFAYPIAGKVKFFIRAGNNTYFVERSERTLSGRTDSLWPLFNAAQDVLTALRPAAPTMNATLDRATVPNFLIPSILVTVGCCMPFGIAAILYAAQVDGKLAIGDIAGARQASKRAKVLSGIGLVLGLFSTGIYILLVLSGAEGQ